MRKLLIPLLLLCFNYGMSQFCSMPDVDFCPGNFFDNGNFENITSDPNTKPDQDIDLSSGWKPIWGTGGGLSSLADLHCNGGSKSTGATPSPNTGVYAGMWIENRPATTTTAPGFREGMYNKLISPIGQNTGIYSFSFKIANALLTGAQNNETHEIGIYGVYNPLEVIANAPTGANSNPTNLMLWNSVDPSIKVVLLGVVSTPPGFTNNWINESISFNSSILPSNGISHIMVTAYDLSRPSGYRKMYVNFDDFCMQLSTTVPTMNQWATLILALLISIISVLFFKLTEPRKILYKKK